MNIFLILTLFSAITKGDDPSFAIKLNNPNPVEFCTSSVLVANHITIDVVGNPNIQGMKISFTEGFIAGEDELVYSGSLTPSTPSAGTLVLTGGSTVQDYIDAIKTITYKNSKVIPTLGKRKITISLSDVDYLPETQHFYRYISNPGIRWSQAKIDAESASYYGLKGYLATITSKVENDFIISKTKGVGYVGATDKDVEGEWRWVTGPEGLLDGGKGLLFWKGTGAQAKADPVNFGPVNGEYNNWDRLEPNNTLQGTNYENYCHITVFQNDPVNSYKWNDVEDKGGTGDWYPQGYIIEFGGLENVTLNLTATLDLQVNTMLFKNEPVSPICEGESIALNQPDLTATYSWTPAQSLSDPLIANPVANPLISTIYSVTANRGECHNTASYIVPINLKPVSILNAEVDICQGAQITLDPGVHQGYSWSNNATSQTIVVAASGDYTVKLTSDKGCTSSSTSKVIVHDFPTIDLSLLQTLICGEAKSIAIYIPTNATEYTLTSTDNEVNIDGLTVSVPLDGVYPMVYKAAIYSACSVEKNFELSFYKIPKVDFTVNDQKCYGYNLEAEYLGDADINSARFTWTFGGEKIADGVGLNKESIPLGVNQSNRNLVLKVEQNGCSDQHTLSDIRVIPTLSMSVVNPILCQPELFDFNAMNTETGVTYGWDFGDGSKGTGPNPQHSYFQSGKYDVQVTVTTNQNCTNTALIKEMVFAAPIPDVAFSLSPDICLEPGVNEISYAGTIGTTRDKYYWDLSQFDSSEISSDPLLTQGPLKFDLKTKPKTTLGLKVITEFGCASLPGSTFVKRKPDFSIQSDLLAGCIPFNPTLAGLINVNDLVDKVDFNWDFGDATTGSGSPVLHTYTDPGKNYTVSLNGISSVTGCERIIIETDFLKTYTKPTAKFSMDNQVVYNDQPGVKFTDLSTGDPTAWLWDFSGESTTTLQNPSYHFTKMGRQKVLLEVTNTDLCTDTISQNLLVAFDQLFPPNGFSPNAPNEIDRVFLLNSEGIAREGYHFTVLSRWNDIVFEAKDEIKGWDGRMEKGAFAPAGAYVWILNFTDFLGRKHRQNGTITLVY